MHYHVDSTLLTDLVESLASYTKKCLSWNSHRDEECFRCQRRPRDDPKSSSDHLEGFRDQDNDLDEFGRPKKRRKPDARWPPPFDKRSATYVFDARCGMFYHAISQFFFHPTTKLYYSNKEQKYYRHTPGEDSPFQPVEQETKEEEPTPAPVQAKATPTIAITLKTKTLPGCEFSATKKVPTPTEKKVAPKQQARTHKKYSANMERWSCRDTLKTKGGQPICPWCRRKFLDLPHLQRHEERSAVHKINVAKWNERKDRDYRDRAWERRLLHGPETPVLAVVEQSAAVATDVVLPQDTLGEGNIGNKMLQKLGWKSGKSLGRTGGGPNQLEKDWDRIESLARNAAGK